MGSKTCIKCGKTSSTVKTLKSATFGFRQETHIDICPRCSEEVINEVKTLSVIDFYLEESCPFENMREDINLRNYVVNFVQNGFFQNHYSHREQLC